MAKGRTGFGSIIENAFPETLGDALNGTSTGGFSPTTLLESLIPGYGAIQKFVLFNFGFDVTILVTLGAIAWIASRLGRCIWDVIWSAVSDAWMSEISVTSRDEIHMHLIHFLGHQSISTSRRLMAETPTKSAWQLDSEATEIPQSTMVSAAGTARYLNFSNQDAKSVPRFTPAIGSHNFWHKGVFFRLRRKEVSMFEDGGFGATIKDQEKLTLSCFGRSTKPIKQLIEDAKAHYHQGHRQKTIIKRPAPKDMRRYGGRGSWIKIAERPCRPMNTVVLDTERKFQVLDDINGYLNPETARWYANRGIPYRRGYLFHGPPGTGKTSLTFAIAGVFGLDIHVVSLLEPTLTEEELGMLFTNLPARCIVLLEDIDTAGLMRNDPAADEEASKSNPVEDKGLDVRTLTRALKKANEDDRKQGISLSGLLNVIDGVASHEGRVLVMTTNHPEKLDKALIRDGRIDYQIEFGNTTELQVQELFKRMYAADVPQPNIDFNTPASPLKNKNINVAEGTDLEQSSPPTSTMAKVCDEKAGNVEANSPEELIELAKAFAAYIPDDLLSPAEVQGFLLKKKREPRKAVAEVEEWVEGMKELKSSGGKVAKVRQ
ncbi:BCS1 N terminal-domain-containing protein [Calycina marina]|uniref:BCS1 N terminal-domain-containing protein n=1 Tax=Calycina marina TaxID=1763456 RepID=A0A9P7Z6P9_9HELO|nr:BCS1 N terminal-domain-containing protein [Calycina marina]